ncbi:hypothetical protein Vadar_013661 [Vaccinium darrowii]|uniref:Uncharacterized protein n=1 Tax=Vaccinium darrowii TaxID=229202 RepID=A0ACB7YFM5_9ERIC|nr:hypothetical protein Vadar_013661 [Vaccinium darrowii]
MGANCNQRFRKIVGVEVKSTAMETQKRKFKAKLKRLQRFGNDVVYNEHKELDKRNWTFTYDGDRRYDIETTNASKSFNGVPKKARHLSIMAMDMTNFYNGTQRHYVRLRRKIVRGTCTMNPASPHKGNHKHMVDLPTPRCTCNKIQLWKNAMFAQIVVCNTMRLEPFQFFTKYWSIDKTIAMYGSLTFKPLPNVPYWPPYNDQQFFQT